MIEPLRLYLGPCTRLETNHKFLNYSQNEIQHHVAQFLREFEKSFVEMSIQNKKAALRRFADLVVVDQREKKAKCDLKRLRSFGPIGSFETIENPILGRIGSLNGNRTRI